MIDKPNITHSSIRIYKRITSEWIATIVNISSRKRFRDADVMLHFFIVSFR